MGNAKEWQKTVIENYEHFDPISFFNPRRNDWDSSWTQELSNVQFTEQVNWELDMIEHADVVFIYFPASSQAPISLLEFGWVMARNPGKVIAVVEPGYWRRGNLEVMCNRERIALHDDLCEGLLALDDVLKSHARFL